MVIFSRLDRRRRTGLYVEEGELRKVRQGMVYRAPQ